MVSRTGALFRSSLTNVCTRDSLRGAIVWFLAGIELCINYEAVFEIVDADGRSFAEANRAQMSGDFEPALVRLFHGGGQFSVRNVHVSLEGRNSHVGPIIDCLARIVRITQRKQLEEVSRRGLPGMAR